jgi:hypothetical protein
LSTVFLDLVLRLYRALAFNAVNVTDDSRNGGLRGGSGR